MIPTDEQTAAIVAASGRDSIMLSAYAGCAKSSTLEMMAPGIHVPALALAFNKKIARDLAGRMPPNFTVKTLNALGHAAWARRPDIPQIKLDDKKIGKLVSDFRPRLAQSEWEWTRQLVSRAMTQGLIPEDTRAEASTEGEWESTARFVGTPADDIPQLVETAQAILRQSIELAFAGTICFDDQIYCPLIFGGHWLKYPVVFIDEAQDLSPMNHRMLQEVLRPGGQLVTVGDPKQAVYAFRGADSDSMTSMRRLSEGWTDLPLTLTFRCPQLIVERQQEHAPGFRTASGVAGRVIKFAEGWTSDDLLAFGPLAVLCRNNAPLLKLGLRLIRRQVGIQMLGRDIGKGLLTLSRRLCPSDDLSNADCRDRILSWQEREIAKGGDGLDAALDRADCLLAVLDSGVASAGGLRQLLETLFAKEGQQVLLSSIHRAKGLEWNTVCHLDPWRIPPRRRLSPEQLQQEMNLRYVCETRTRDVLILANLDEMETK